MDAENENKGIRILNEYDLITKRWKNPIQLHENEKQFEYSMNSKSATKVKEERSTIV